MSDVSVISCLYGDSHDQFIEEWFARIVLLVPEPHAVIIGTDRSHGLSAVTVAEAECTWKHPQAFHLQAALDLVETEWVWIHDIDDLAFPDALAGLDDVVADVWQMGYLRSDGETYLPPQLTAAEVLASDRNPFVAGSCVRVGKLREVGGFPDVALQDWALWRALARADATFEASGCVHFHYRRHPQTRGAVELTAGHRQEHMAEMLAWEETVAVTV